MSQHDPILNPTSAESPLVAMVKRPLSSMTEDEKRAELDRIRELRGVAAQKKKAVNTSAKAANAAAKGFSIDELI